MINLNSPFNECYEELSDINEAAQKKYEICYREDEDGPKKRFTVFAGSEAEAKQIAWSSVDADDIWVSEIKEDLQEANKIVQRFDRPVYSGSFSGLNNIAGGTSADELERKKKAEEEAKKKVEEEAKKKAEEEAKKKAEEEQRLEWERKEFEKAANKAIAENRVAFYNYNHRYDISRKDYCPAVDLETNEFVYDPARKEEILKASESIVDEVRSAAAQKGLRTRAANQAAEAEFNAKAYVWTAYFTFNDGTHTVTNKVIGNEDPEGACAEIKAKAIQRIKAEMHECKMFKEPFQWDGKLIITVTPPRGEDEVYKKYKFNTKA